MQANTPLPLYILDDAHKLCVLAASWMQFNEFVVERELPRQHVLRITHRDHLRGLRRGTLLMVLPEAWRTDWFDACLEEAEILGFIVVTILPTDSGPSAAPAT